jgi:hypothetical protein
MIERLFGWDQGREERNFAGFFKVDVGWKKETVADMVTSTDAGWSPQCDDVPARDGEWGVLKTTVRSMV